MCDKKYKKRIRKKENIKQLILIPCNAGHQDYIYDNVAHAFSKKIKGSVTASDGTVVLNDYPSHVNKNSIFSSEADTEWRYYVTGVRKKM